jgi:hypothetical protein
MVQESSLKVRKLIFDWQSRNISARWFQLSHDSFLKHFLDSLRQPRTSAKDCQTAVNSGDVFQCQLGANAKLPHLSL